MNKLMPHRRAHQIKGIDKWTPLLMAALFIVAIGALGWVLWIAIAKP